MSAATECKDRLENLVALTLGELDVPAARELRDHLAVCIGCRRLRDALRAEEQQVRVGFASLACNLAPGAASVLDNLPVRQARSPRDLAGANHGFLERTRLMIRSHKRACASTAAVLALAASLACYALLFSSPAVYALEQTARANDKIRSCHIKITPTIYGLSEAWIQFDANGAATRIRLDFPLTEDGPKTTIISGDRAEVWFKWKNCRLICRDAEALNSLMKGRASLDRSFKIGRAAFDPKLAFEELQTQRKAGRVQVETEEPTRQGEPITLTVTSRDMPDRREVYEVDPATKLVQRVADFRQQDSRWERIKLREYLQYNQEIDPKVFQLDLPGDVIVVDQISRQFGLPRGDLSDEEIAIKAAREFYEALIAQDYEKAGSILGGLPAEVVRKQFAGRKILRVVSVGKPTADRRTESLRVPVKVELERDGRKTTEDFQPFVRHLYKQPDWWNVSGGY